jgi:hypothetical protein
MVLGSPFTGAPHWPQNASAPVMRAPQTPQNREADPEDGLDRGAREPKLGSRAPLA